MAIVRGLHQQWFLRWKRYYSGGSQQKKGVASIVKPLSKASSQASRQASRKNSISSNRKTPDCFTHRGFVGVRIVDYLYTRM
jgi:TFIIF-interacting CTD phosphatase-like protein